MSELFSPFQLRDLTLKNRIVASPTCQYSAVDGAPNDWHLVTYGGRAIGGAGMVMVESTAVSPNGRIAPYCTGIWSDRHIAPWRKIAEFIKKQGCVPAIQLTHSGRKGSCDAPWNGRRFLSPQDGGWQTDSCSEIPYGMNGVPHELTPVEVDWVVGDFIRAASRAKAAGFEAVEVHCAHGYLLNSYLSPLTNPGKTFEERCIVPLMVIEQVRNHWPQHLPVFVRISATDWVVGGWSISDSINFAIRLKGIGVDIVDVSSGGILPDSQVDVLEKDAVFNQVWIADAIRCGAGVQVGAVGMITEPKRAESIIANGKADLVFMARALMRNPNWPLMAAKELGADIKWPNQLQRANL